MSTFTRKKRESLHDFNFFSVECDTIHESTHDLTFTRNVVAHVGAVAVVPVMDNGDVVLIKQYRGTVDQELIEAVAGRRDIDNEDLFTCALRELGEEIGLTAKNIVSLGSVFTSPGFTDEEIHLFVATECSELDRSEPDGIEELLSISVRIPMAQALEWTYDGTISDAKSIITIQRVAHWLDSLISS